MLLISKIKIWLFIISVSLFVSSCSYMQKTIDRRSIHELANDINVNFNAGNPDSLKAFLSTFCIVVETTPAFDTCVKLNGKPQWNMESPNGTKIIQERFSFPSLILKNGKPDSAYFYIYRKGDFSNRKVILWIPGYKVSDDAFKYIKKFFRIELLNDYDIVFYVPPYHLERKVPGKNSGDGFFTANTLQNMHMLANMTREIRTMYKYLQSRHVKSISGWGGSTGASSLLIASAFDKFENLTLMIPVVDWSDIALKNPMMQKIHLQLNQKGFADSLLKQAYKNVSPVNYISLTKPENIQIQYSEFDQLIPAKTIEDFCNENNIRKRLKYQTSHGTILLSDKMFSDYGTFLNSLKN